MSSRARVPFQENEVAEYERKRYRGLDQRIVHGRETRILRKMLKTAGAEQPADRRTLALDAPCGYGRFSGLLLEAGFRPVNCDLSLAMVRRARAKDKISPNPAGAVGNVTQGLPFRGGAFPLVFSLRLFHHLHTPEERRAAFGEFARAGSGWLILSFYRVHFLHQAQRALRRRVMKTKTRIKMISRREFKDEAARAGFRIVRITPLFRGVHAHNIALLKKSE